MLSKFFGQDMQAALFLFQRNIVGPTMAGSSRAWRINRRVRHIEFKLFHRLSGIIKLFVGFACKSNNNIGKKGSLRNNPTNALYDIPVAFHVVFTVHPHQNFIIAALHGQVNLFGQHRVFCNYFNYFFGHITRVRRGKIHPKFLFHSFAQLTYLAQKLWKTDFLPFFIQPIRIYILPEQGNRFISLRHEQCYFGKNIF